MSESGWGWVDRLELRNIESKDMRNRLAYLAVTTVLVQISIGVAKDLSRSMKDAEQDARLSALEERVRKLENPDTDLTSALLQGLLAASIALPINFMVAEFAAIAFSQLRVIRMRRHSWQREFKSKSYKDPSVRTHHTKAWERDRKKHFKNSIRGTAEKLRTGDRAKAWKEGHTVDIAGSLALILAVDSVNDIAKPKTAKAPKAAKTPNWAGSAINTVEFWNTLPQLADQMQSQVTFLADDVRWMEEREIPLFNDGEFLVKTSKRLLPYDIKWLTDALDRLLEVDDWQEPDKSQWKQVAVDRLAHIWLTQYISLFVPPTPQLEEEFYGLLPGEWTRYHQSRYDPVRRLTPYKVDGKEFLSKVRWSQDPVEKLKAQIMVANIRRSPEFLETYMDIAIRKVSVDPARWRKQQANIQISNSKKYYVPPKLEDARLEYAYTLLAFDIVDLRTKQFRENFTKIIASPFPWQAINNFWRAI